MPANKPVSKDASRRASVQLPPDADADNDADEQAASRPVGKAASRRSSVQRQPSADPDEVGGAAVKSAAHSRQHSSKQPDHKFGAAADDKMRAGADVDYDDAGEGEGVMSEGSAGGAFEQDGEQDAADVEASEGLEAAESEGGADSRRVSGPEAEVQDEVEGAEQDEGSAQGSRRGSAEGEEIGEDADLK